MSSPKSTNMMYVQQLAHLPAKDLDTLKDVVEQKVKPKRYAMILHDKEQDKEGNPRPPDVHVMMTFDNARYVTSVAKILGDKPQYLEVWDGNHENGYAYLVHATKKAREEGKHQYDPSEVIANFDYPDFLIEIRTKTANAAQPKDLTAKNLLDALYAGVLPKEEVERRMTGSQLAYYKRQIDTVWNKVLENQAAEWRKEMIEQGKQITVIWLYGTSGTGKTRMARDLAERENRPYYVAGSSRDIFQDYSGQHILILDELRPKVMAYQDLLRILDPFGARTGVKAPARYVDKTLAADLILVTSPYSPHAFWQEQFSAVDKNKGSAAKKSLAEQGVDGFDQLERRIGVTIRLEQNFIAHVKPDPERPGVYETLSIRTPNPYSSKNSPASAPDSAKLFASLFT